MIESGAISLMPSLQAYGGDRERSAATNRRLILVCADQGHVVERAANLLVLLNDLMANYQMLRRKINPLAE
jgi:hypothetical protein